MKKRIISLLAALALTVGTLAGCGSSADKTAEKSETEAAGESEAAGEASEGEDETAEVSSVKAG